MANTLTSTQLVQAKEAFAQTISNIDPTETPFISSIGAMPISNTVYQWLEDTYDAPAVNAQIEGFVPTPDVLVQPSKRQNNTQIFEKTVEVTRTAQEIAVHGRAREMAYQMNKKARSIKRDLELACVGTKQTAVTGGAGVAPQMAGVQAQVDPSLIFSKKADGTTNLTGLDESALVAAKTKLYIVGADAEILLANPLDRASIDAYQGNAGRERTIVDGNKTVTNSVTIYASSFGDIRVTMDRYIAPGDAILYSSDDWKLLVFDAWNTYDLAKVGDKDTKMIVGEYSLMNKNRLSTAIIRHA